MKLRALFLLLGPLGLGVFDGFSQSSAFTYQGRLLSGTNAPTGLYDFNFALFDQAANGTQQGGTVAALGVPVTDGLFTTQLDFGSNVFSGLPRWLELSVHRAGDGLGFSLLTPRQQVVSSPYAVRAATASAYGGAITDAQLSTNVALRNANQTFSGNVQFSSATGTFTGNGAGLTNLNVSGGSGGSGKGGCFSGRVNQLPNSAITQFAAPTGISDASPNEAQTTLSPNVALTATNFCVRLEGAPGTGNSLTFRLRANGADTALVCTLAGSATSTNSGAASAALPAGAVLSIRIEATGAPNAGSALFGWEAK
jgi:hypothetical protein